MTEIRLARFSSSPVLAVGAALGILDAYGVRVTESVVTSSRQQFADLAAGAYDVVLTSPDNVLRHSATAPGLQMLRGVDHGLGLSLLTRPELTDPADLRGARIGVDAPDSGFALVLYEFLARAGLDRHDVHLSELGTTPMRARALADGHCDATMLNAGHDVVAEAAGANRMLRATDVLGPYLGSVLATNTPAGEHESVGITDFLGAWDRAVAETLAPRNHDLVVAGIADTLGCPRTTAETCYATLIDPAQGLRVDGEVQGPALETVRRLRASRAPDPSDASS